MPRITVRAQGAEEQVEEEEEEDAAPVEAKEELLKLLLPHPSLREALRVPRSAQGLVLLEALSNTPNKFETLRNSGLSLAEAVKVVDLLDLALQAPEETKQRRIAARSVLTRCCLPFLCLTELFVCGLLIYTLESSTGGWNIGKCSLVTFTNITCTEQTTRCAVDVEVRATQGDLRFYTKQGWHLPVSHKTEMGGGTFASYLGESMKCCNDDSGRVGPCCELMDPASEIFCDNLALLGRKAYDGSDCPVNGWDCLFLIDDFDPAQASDLKLYTPPDILSFLIVLGAVMVCLVTAVSWTLIVRYCDCSEMVQRKLEWVQQFASRAEDEADVEVVEMQPQPTPDLRPSMTGLTEVSTVGEEERKPVMTRMTTRLSKRGTKRLEDEIIISPELSHVPEALLALPGVVQELEAVIEDKSGKARQKALEEECRKYVKWDAHEKPLTELDSEDIHPHFKLGNLNRYVAMMANKPEMGLAPLIEPLPPSMHAPPRPGSKAGRPGTAGRPQAWVRPGSAKRPPSALRAARPGSARPTTPASKPVQIEVANL